MAVTDTVHNDGGKAFKEAVLRDAAEEVEEWLEANPPPEMPPHVSTVDGHILQLDPSGTQYIIVSGMGDPRAARQMVQRLNAQARDEAMRRDLGYYDVEDDEVEPAETG